MDALCLPPPQVCGELLGMLEAVDDFCKFLGPDLKVLYIAFAPQLRRNEWHWWLCKSCPDL